MQLAMHQNDDTASSWSGLVTDFPTIADLEDGSRSYWSIPKPALDMRMDVDFGFDLAVQTISLLKERQTHNGVLAKILEQAPTDCCVAKGFRLAIEQQILQNI